MAVWDGSHVLKHLVIKPPGPDKACYEERVHLIRKTTRKVCAFYKPDLAIIEAPSYGPSPPIGLWMTYGVVKHGLWSMGQPFYDGIAPTTLKVYFTGNARASKDEMVARALKWLPDLTDKDHDIADALALAQYGYDNYETLTEEVSG